MAAANMQHMMMPPAQGQQPMRSAPSLRDRVFQSIAGQRTPPNGWQASYPAQERMQKAMNLITNFSLGVGNHDLAAANAGLEFEQKTFLAAPDKAAYERQMESKIQDLFQRRKNQGPNVQNTLNAQATAAQAQHQAQAQQFLMNPNAMMQMGRGTGQARPQGPNPQQNFQHLQHQMQASPMPQQQAPMGMHMNPVNMGMNMGMAGPGGQPMGPNASMMGMMGGGQGQGQGQGQGRGQPAPPNGGLTPHDRQRIFEAASKRVQTMPEAQKSHLRSIMASRLPQNQLSALQAQGRDLALVLVQQQLSQQLVNNRGAGAGGPPMNMGGNPSQAALLQQQRHQLNQGGINSSPQQTSGNPLGQLDNLLSQQKAGMMAQEAGQVVVPASSSHGHNANQPMGQMPNLNMQHSQSNLGHTPQSQPDQRPPMAMSQSPANQMPTRIPGGPQPGMPPSQSPGQPAASRPPGEPIMETSAAPGPGGFNAGLDPRFNQPNNQLPLGGAPNGNNPIVNSQFFASLGPEQQRAFLNIPVQKQMEIIQKNMGPRAPRPNQQAFMNQNGPGMNAGAQMAAHNPMASGEPGQPNGQPLGVNLARLDGMEVPPQLIQSLNAPAEVKTWRDLKQYCARTPGHQQHLQRLNQIQKSQYQAILRRSGQMGQGQGQGQPGMPPGMPNQQGPMNGPPGMPMNMAAAQRALQAPVTDQEMARIRELDPKFNAMSNEELRNYVVSMRMMTLRQKMQGQQQPQAMGAPPMQGRPSTGPQQLQQPQQPQPQPQPFQQPPQAQPPPSAASPAGQAPGAAPPKKAAAGKKAGGQKPAAKSPAQPQKGVKRPFPDEGSEGAAQKHALTANQRTASQQGQSQPAPPQGQGAERPQAKNQPMAANAALAEDHHRMKAIQDAQIRRVEQEQVEVPVPPEALEEYRRRIVHLAALVSRTSRIIQKWYSHYHDDERTAVFFHLKHKILRQFEDGNIQKNLKPPLTMTASEMKHGGEVMISIHRDCAKQQGAVEQPAPQAAAAGNEALAPAQPAQRKSQPQAQAPAQPPFQVGATSPQGEPKYMNAAKDMNLHIPPKKKAKTTQAKPAPAAPPAAEAKPPTPKPPAKPLFYCTEADCEAAAVGFPSEEAKQAHVQAEHVQPSQDPRKFFQENLAATLGLDLEGNALGEAGMSASQSRQGQTPSFAPTPMSRGPSMNRSASGAGAKPKEKEAKPPGKEKADAFATIDPQALLADIPGFNSVAGGVFSDPAVLQALTPNDTPDSKDSGATEATGEPPEVGELDLDADWHVFGSGLMRAAELEAELGGEVDEWDKAVLLDAAGSGVPEFDWGEVNVDFGKPFEMDTSLYSMDPTALG